MAVLRHPTVFQIVLNLFILNYWGGFVFSLDAPDIQVIEIIPFPDNHTTAETVRHLDKPRNSEIVVGQDITTNSRLVLRCTANYPVQFVYIGSGRPELTTYTNEWEGSTNSERFEAGVSIGLGLVGFHQTLREEDSGNYTCRSIEDPKVLSYHYIYVPGPSIFLPPDGYDAEIYFGSKDKEVKIPCAVAHPNATVQLFRTSNGKLTCPALDGKRASFDSKKGFILNLKDLKSPEGTYVCVASYQDQFRMIEYQLLTSKYPVGSPCRNSLCGNKAECDVVDGYPVCYCFRGLMGNPYNGCEPSNTKRCFTASDCAKGQFCTRGQCTKDPCSPSPCGKGSLCQAVQGRASCSCREGYSGSVPYCIKKCSSDSECSKDERCASNVCQSVCTGACGKNAACSVVIDGKRRRAECSCYEGYSGNPKQECRPSQCVQDSDCPFNNYCSRGKCIPVSPPPTSPSKPNCRERCGVNAECVYSKRTQTASCQCRSGTTGDPLAECFEECPADNQCGRGSLCRVEKNLGRSEYSCFCPRGTTNVPLGPEITCLNDTAIPGPGDCYRRNPCPPTASCQMSRKSGQPECVCPAGSSGDPRVQCFAKECPPGVCGIGAKCSISLGEPQNEPTYVCTCPPDKTGDPYERCVSEPSVGTCARNICSPDEACLVNFRTGEQICSPCPSGTRADSGDGVCYGKCSRSFQCGRDANCRTRVEAGRTVSECYCPVGTSGDPQVACSPPNTSPDLCYRNNPCPPGSVCTLTRQGEVDCICPSGFTGTYPNCRPEEKRCREDRDCDAEEECIGGLCLTQCAISCGRFGTCETRGRRIKCICFKGYELDNNGVCTSEGVMNVCTPSSCGVNAECRDDRRPLLCVCPNGYDGNPYERCVPRRFTGLSPPQSAYPLSPPNNQEGFLPSPPGSTIISAPDRFFRRNGERPKDECDPRYGSVGGITYQCNRGLKCRRDSNGIARCLPVRPRFCQTSSNCREMEVCRNSTCFSPCHPENSPCAGVPFAECRVIEGRALCACQRGYAGSPLSGLGCKPDRPERRLPLIGEGDGEPSEPSPVILCDVSKVGTPDGCDQQGECQLVNDSPICVCGKEYEGIYPECQMKCRLDLDCPEGQACMNFQCISPCEVPNACGSNADCRVDDHRPICECQDGFVGDAIVGCSLRNNAKEGTALLSSSGSSAMNCTGNRCTFF